VPRKPPDEVPPSVPTSFPDITPPLPSGDYSYTVELVGRIQHQLGKLTEAVESMKVQIKDHGSEIKDISKDIHTAKTTVKIVGAILAALLAFAAWAINKGVDAYVASHAPTSSSAVPQK